MVSAASTLPKIEEERYLALLRAANAIATSDDCRASSEVLVRELREVTPFSFLHVVIFDQDTKQSCWSLLEVDGESTEPSLTDELSGEDSPIQWVHGAGQTLSTADWSTETRFPKYALFLADRGVIS